MNWDDHDVRTLLFRTIGATACGMNVKYTLKMSDVKGVAMQQKKLKDGRVEVYLRFTGKARRARG